jgi:hypothetical protein
LLGYLNNRLDNIKLTRRDLDAWLLSRWKKSNSY